MTIKGAARPVDVVKDMIKSGGIKISKYPLIFVGLYRFLYARTRINLRIANKLVVVFPNTDIDFWIKLQRDYDESKLEEEIK